MTGFQPDGTGSNPVTRSKCVRSSTAEWWIVSPRMTVRVRPYTPFALVVELADTLVLETSAARRGGSSPPKRTNKGDLMDISRIEIRRYDGLIVVTKWDKHPDGAVRVAEDTTWVNADAALEKVKTLILSPGFVDVKP